MKHLFTTLVLAVATALTTNAAESAKTPAEYVKTTMGTKLNGFKSGYCVPGATRPFGMVQFSTPIVNKAIGFCVNQTNAGCPHMGNFPVLPVNGAISTAPGHMTDGRVGISDECGHAGYYTARVQHDTRVELTATRRTGQARFTFPDGGSSVSVIIGGGICATSIDRAAMVITGPRSCEGFADGGNFCGRPTPYTVYFAAEFDRDAVCSGTWKGERLSKESIFCEGADSGVYFTFDADGQPLGYKFAISYVSIDNAKENLRTENPGWDFDAVRKEAESEWNSHLSKIEVEVSDEDRKVQFYSHLYHALMFPNTFNDICGEYMGPDRRIHRTTGTEYTNFSNWDTYRTQIQLLALLEEDVASDVVLSHRHFAEQSGDAFPRWVMAGIETGIMQGDPSALVVANAWAFGARGFDPAPLLRIMRKCGDTPGLKCNGFEVRPHLQDYLEKGYTNASLQLEYTSADFAISRFAIDACNEAFTHDSYAERARSWKNLYNPSTGFLQCRDENGAWRPLRVNWNDYDEAPWQVYFWMVPYNIAGLIDIAGGRNAAEAKLDSLVVTIDASPFEAKFWAGNEPEFQVPWIYNWMGRPDKTNDLLRRILRESYSSRVDGLPGNDDLGTMGAWYVFTCLGLYPMIPGVGGFTLSTPLFEKATVHLPGGDLTVKGGSEKNIYTSSASLNGRKVDTAWLDLEQIRNGGTLIFKSSSKPSGWGTDTVPPSFE